MIEKKNQAAKVRFENVNAERYDNDELFILTSIIPALWSPIMNYNESNQKWRQREVSC